jgi:lipid A ethanolaminephosphotransferase
LATDEFLARTIRYLAQDTSRDTAMIYLSDHGESLGENGLYLHGVPYSIAPKTQTRVPMVMWFSPGFSASRGLDVQCLRKEASQPASQDNLFHSVLGLMQVETRVYQKRLDLFASCDRRVVATR